MTFSIMTLSIMIFSIVNDKTTCQDKIKLISNNYFQMYKTLQLFTGLITFNTNIFTSIKFLKTYVHIFAKAKKLLKMPSSLKHGFS